MRIEIRPSAKAHGILAVEIRAIINHPELRYSLITRRTDVAAAPILHVARPAANEPHIEIIADLIDPAVAIVFHAMMLRPTLVRKLDLDLFIAPEYAPQRA